MLDPTRVVAGIGSRELGMREAARCYYFGLLFADYGWGFRTGRARGADERFAFGYRLGFGVPQYCVPWDSYNLAEVDACRPPAYSLDRLDPAARDRLCDLVRTLHPAGPNLTNGAMRLHARNIIILLGPNLDDPVKAVFALPRLSGHLGGTGFGMQLARHYDIPLFDLRKPSEVRAAERWIKTS